jgi:rod shape-determining protein MreC
MTYQSRRGALRPFRFLMEPINYANGLILSVGTSVSDAFRIAAGQKREIERLKEELAGLKMRAQRLEETREESERLWEILSLRELQPGFVAAARVVSKGSDRWSNVFIIDKGSDHDVRKDMAAITPDGLLGKVHEVSPSYSTVLLIDDSQFSAAVRFQSDRTEAVLRGKGQGRCILKYVSTDASPENGDVLVTSGLDAMFPAGIRAGYVSSVSTDEKKLFHDVEAVPFVDTRKVEEVIIVTR